jgi:hypothetical protein
MLSLHLPAAALCLAALTAVPAAAQSPASSRPDKDRSAKKKPASPEERKFEAYLGAQKKFLGVLERYAAALASATDAASAESAVTRIDTIIKDLVSAGEAMVLLGPPSPEIEDRLTKHPQLSALGRKVGLDTRKAMEAIAAKPEVKAVLAPAIERFQAAMNRLQQTARDPAGPGQNAPAAAPTPTDPATNPGSPAADGKPEAPEASPAEPAKDPK